MGRATRQSRSASDPLQDERLDAPGGNKDADATPRPYPAASAGGEFRLEQTSLRSSGDVQIVKSSLGLGWESVFAAVTREQPHEALHGAVQAVWLSANLVPAEVRRWFPGSEVYQTLQKNVTTITAAGEPVFNEVVAPLEAVHIFLRQSIVEVVADDLYSRGEMRPTVRSVIGAHDSALQSFVASIGASMDLTHSTTLEMDCLAHALAAHLLHRYSAPTHIASKSRVAKALNSRQLGAVVDYIEDNLASGLSLAELACVAGVGRAQFLQGFKAATSVTPHRYVLARRVRRSQRYLADRKIDHLSIAEMCGFVDQSHFASTFKRMLKMTPREYRRSTA